MTSFPRAELVPINLTELAHSKHVHDIETEGLLNDLEVDILVVLADLLHGA